MARLRFLTGLVLAAALVGALVAVLSAGGGLRPGQPVPYRAAVDVLLRGIAQRGELLGSPAAPVALVEYADPQCPFCARFAREVLPGLIRDFVRRGRLAIRLRLLTSIGSDSLRAARFAQAAGAQDRLWQFSELLFDNQQPENTGYVTDAFLRQIAGAVTGLDVARALRERAGVSVAQAVRADHSAAVAARVRATPWLVVSAQGTSPREVAPDGLRALVERLAAR